MTRDHTIKNYDSFDIESLIVKQMYLICIILQLLLYTQIVLVINGISPAANCVKLVCERKIYFKQLSDQEPRVYSIERFIEMTV